MKHVKRLQIGLWLQIAFSLLFVMTVVAQASSSNYSINEVFIGTGGINEDLSSTSYSARATVGEFVVGNIVGTSFQANAGFETTDKPFLEVSVATTNVDMGLLDKGSASTDDSVTFTVRSYLATGYIVTTHGLPTSEGGTTLAPMTTAGGSSPGTEQFGINLVANTVPTTFGANPINTSISFGQAATGYNTTNVYKYIDGDTIASSSSSSGNTTYTISYLYNISGVTEAGLYTHDHVLIVTSTF